MVSDTPQYERGTYGVSRAEPFNDDGSFRQDVFFNTLGQGYIATALRAAKAADPNAKVYINDFNIEGTGIVAMLTLFQPSHRSQDADTSQAQRPPL